LFKVELNPQALHDSFKVQLPTEDEDILEWRQTGENIVVQQQSKLLVVRVLASGVCSVVFTLQQRAPLWLCPFFCALQMPFVLNAEYKRVVDLNRDGFAGAVLGV
jgi:hypothetical protein